tara:strand:- start:1051 stop:1260 length:210 start_codon:yes stop_codon:yes gene_type:complete
MPAKKKTSCTPRKGKAKCKVVNGKKVSYGQKGVKVGKVGSKRWKSYCSRSAGIKNGGAANRLARKRWKC